MARDERGPQQDPRPGGPGKSLGEEGTVVALQAGEMDHSPKLLAEYEEILGPLRPLDRPIRLEGDIPWGWSWTPEEAAMFLAEITRTIYLVNPRIRDLCYSMSPNGKHLMFERFCPVEIRKALDDVQAIADMPWGAIPPIPKGPCSIDLRQAPIFGRPRPITINGWHFSGLVSGISKELRDQLAEIHGRYIAEANRVILPMDHASVDLGEVRA